MEPDEIDVSQATIRPDWWVPASIVVRGVGGLFGIVYQSCNHLADTFVAYSNHRDERIDFHQAVALDIETLTEEGTDG